jgi:hypothetical protein
MVSLCQDSKNEELKDMAWPVTRHTQIPLEGGFRRVAYGIDSLDIGFYVQWNGRWDVIHEALQSKKEQAWGEEGIRPRAF